MDINSYNTSLEKAAKLCEFDAECCQKKIERLQTRLDETPNDDLFKERLGRLVILQVHYNRLAGEIRSLKLDDAGNPVSTDGQNFYHILESQAANG